jgi:hypothetical protein
MSIYTERKNPAAVEEREINEREAEREKLAKYKTDQARRAREAKKTVTEATPVQPASPPAPLPDRLTLVMGGKTLHLVAQRVSLKFKLTPKEQATIDDYQNRAEALLKELAYFNPGAARARFESERASLRAPGGFSREALEKFQTDSNGVAMAAASQAETVRIHLDHLRAEYLPICVNVLERIEGELSALLEKERQIETDRCARYGIEGRLPSEAVWSIDHLLGRVRAAIETRLENFEHSTPRDYLNGLVE